LAAVTSGSAAPRWHGGAPFGAGIAGFALGAAVAGAAAVPYYGYAPYGYGYGYGGGYYDYAPDAVVAPGPYYAAPYGYGYGYGWRRHRECRFGISGC
jgi:hypothetical protein